MRTAFVMFLVFATAVASELSCNLRAARGPRVEEHPAELKAIKTLRRKSGAESNGKLPGAKGGWELDFDCHNPITNKSVLEKFTCAPEYNKLKFVFIQNRKVSSTFIDLQPSLISFNKFVGLDLRNIVIRAEPHNCEIWIESASLFKALAALLLAWLM